MDEQTRSVVQPVNAALIDNKCGVSVQAVVIFQLKHGDSLDLNKKRVFRRRKVSFPYYRPLYAAHSMRYTDRLST